MGWTAWLLVALLLLLLLGKVAQGALGRKQVGGLSAEQQAREEFKQGVAYPRRIEPTRPVTVVVRHRCGAHAEHTRKWV